MLIIAILFAIGLQAHAPTWSKLIMIDPAGHAKSPGRKLHKNYERAETYKCAEALKRSLEQNFHVRVILTRDPGDEIVPLQNASFANRLNIDFFLRINFYTKDLPKPKLGLYNLVFDPIIDTVNRPFNPQAFIPVNQAHFKCVSLTKSLASQMTSLLGAAHYQKLFDIGQPCSLPLKPLVGITAPALLLEACLPWQDDQWNDLVTPLAESIAHCLDIRSRVNS